MKYDRRFYSYDRRKVADAEDLKPKLLAFERIVESLAQFEDKYRDKKDDWGEQISMGATTRATFSFVKKYGLQTLFWGLLQQYQMSNTDRRIIERASKTFSKKQVNRIRPEKAYETYTSHLKEYRLFLETARRVFNSGKLHTEDSETTSKAGCFTLVNAGGFSDKQMEDVQKVVEAATRKLKAKGLSKVCYGNIQVTNKIGKSNVLAFYYIQNDEMFVRGNLKGKQGPAEDTILHELGHRLHYKFLKSKDDQIKSIYKTLKGDENAILQNLMYDKDKHPKPGETMQSGRTTYVVDGVKVNNRYDYVVLLHDQKAPEQKASVLLKKWFQLEGGLASAGSFVSPYASKDYAENFAEMIDHYCQGTLPEGQVAMLEAVL